MVLGKGIILKREVFTNGKWGRDEKWTDGCLKKYIQGMWSSLLWPIFGRHGLTSGNNG